MEHLLGTIAHEPDEELVMLRAEAVDAPARAELRRFVSRCADYQQLEEWTGSVRTPELRQLRRFSLRIRRLGRLQMKNASDLTWG